MKNAILFSVFSVCAVVLFALGLVAGGVVTWLYRNNLALESTNTNQADAIATIVAAAPKIAAEIDSLRQAQRASTGIASDFAALRPTLDSLAACPLSAEYARLLLAQDRAINAAGSDPDKPGLPED